MHKFNASATKLVVVLSILFTTSSLTGCGGLMHAALTSKLPSYAEVEKSWGPIPTGKARLVVYWPSPSLGIMGGGFSEIKVDNSRSVTLVDGTFAYFDLSPGAHTVTMEPPSIIYSRKSTEVSVAADNLTFVLIQRIAMGGDPPKLVEPQLAKADLAKMQHFDKVVSPRPAP